MCSMPLQVKFGVYRKGFQFVVTTVIDDRISRLEEEVKRKEENEKDMVKKMKEIEGKHAILQTEVAKLRCLFTSVEVAVKPLKPADKEHM